MKPPQKLPALFYKQTTILPHILWYQPEKTLNNIHSAKCERYIWPTNKMQTQPMKCAVPNNAPYWFYGYLNSFPLFICPMAGRMWRDGPLDLLCAWGQKKRQLHRGLEKERIGRHVLMLQICSLPHMWIGMPLSGALLVLHEQRHSQGDKQAVTEVTPSLNLLWYRITRFMSCLKLYPLIVSQDFRSRKVSKPLMAVH